MSVQGVSANSATMEDNGEETLEDIEGSFSMSVADAAAFSANAGVVDAVAAAIAQVAGVDATTVIVTLTGGARRLQGESRQLQASVLAGYAIPDASSSALTALQNC